MSPIFDPVSALKDDAGDGGGTNLGAFCMLETAELVTGAVGGRSTSGVIA